MKLAEVKEKAKKAGVVVNAKMDKTAMVRAIQHKEGYNPCFATPAVKTCGQAHCLWRQDCMAA